MGSARHRLESISESRCRPRRPVRFACRPRVGRRRSLSTAEDCLSVQRQTLDDHGLPTPGRCSRSRHRNRATTERNHSDRVTSHGTDQSYTQNESAVAARRFQMSLGLVTWGDLRQLSAKPIKSGITRQKSLRSKNCFENNSKKPSTTFETSSTKPSTQIGSACSHP